MSAKRRDNRNRILRNGESQRKDGRYMYKYIDNVGNAKYVYMILSILVDTFISKISLPMQPVPEIGSISVA